MQGYQLDGGCVFKDCPRGDWQPADKLRNPALVAEFWRNLPAWITSSSSGNAFSDTATTGTPPKPRAAGRLFRAALGKRQRREEAKVKPPPLRAGFSQAKRRRAGVTRVQPPSASSAHVVPRECNAFLGQACPPLVFVGRHWHT